MTLATNSIHVVRRFGPVGGMERYVWELTHSLQALGQSVSVICEITTDTPHPDIRVIELGKIPEKPRWLSMLRFSASVSATIKQLTKPKNSIIHSHERTNVHDVSSFHGPSILSRKKKILDALSPRLLVWESLEKREVCSKGVKAVIPNSKIVSDQLIRFYPEAKNQIVPPMYPGVADVFFPAPKRPNQKIVGFIGREWQRKGLEYARDVIEKIRMDDPEVKLMIAGCPKEEVQHLFKHWEGGYELMGWCEPELFYRQIDLLILPSKNEPFGMVVAEANASNVPVLISAQCGVAPLISPPQGMVLPLSSAVDTADETRAGVLDQWVTAGRQLLGMRDDVPPLNLTWAELAKQHIALYSRLSQP